MQQTQSKVLENKVEIKIHKCIFFNRESRQKKQITGSVRYDMVE